MSVCVYVPTRLGDQRECVMQIELTDHQCSDLRDLLKGTLGDLSTEIAATDNASYRDGLREWRASLEGVLSKLPVGEAG